MTSSTRYIFALQLEDFQRFMDIFGHAVSSKVWDDIVNGYAGITEKLLRSYKIVSGVTPLFTGRCFCIFALRRSDISIDMEEQIVSLEAAGNLLIRKMLTETLGTATGSRLNYKIAVISMPEDDLDFQEINKKLDSIFKARSCASCLFPPETRAQLENIIKKKKVETFFQPIVSLPREEVVGYEALSRGAINNSFLEADLLFSAALQFGLTDELELVCIEKALDWIAEIPGALWLSVNIGPSLLKSHVFADLICQERFKPFRSRLVFELTEHLPIDSVNELNENIRHLNQLGICLSLDDTGCGFLDLYSVEKFRPKIVKLCITVIRRLGESDEILSGLNRTVSRIADYCQYVLGEGVEQKSQVDILKKTGVSMAQGFYFDKPKPAIEVLGSPTVLS